MSRPLVVSALLIIAAIFVVPFASALQSHQHVRLLQRQLNEAKQQLAQSKAANADLEKNVAKLNTELDSSFIGLCKVLASTSIVTPSRPEQA